MILLLISSFYKPNLDTTMATKLDRLNELLKEESLALPSFRTSVDKSGNNLAWLKKHVGKNANASEELKSLMFKPIKELLLPLDSE